MSVTRNEKVERYFRNSIRDAILDMMEVMDPGEHLRWRSLNYKELLKTARDRIDAELLHEENFEIPHVVGTSPVPESFQSKKICLECGVEIEQPNVWTRGDKYPLCESCGKADTPKEVVAQALALPESSVRASEN